MPKVATPRLNAPGNLSRTPVVTQVDRYFATGVSADLVRGPLRITTQASLDYEHIHLGGYAETGPDSSQMSFGAQTLETATVSVDFRISAAGDAARLRPYLSVDYSLELLNRRREIKVTPSGAPVSFTTDAYKADDSYLTCGVGVSARLGDRLELIAGVEGVADREAMDDARGFITLQLCF